MRTGRSHVLELLGSHGPIAEQIERQRRHAGLLDEVRALLPVAERPHCVHVSREGETLSLTLDSAAWATRLRYRIPDLAAALAPRGITGVKVKIQPAGAGVPGRSAASRGPVGTRLSASVVSHLLAAADQMDDPELGEALRRLAYRHGGGGPPVSQD